MLRIRDPVLFWALELGWKKSGSGINISDHISDCLVTIFWVKNTKFFVNSVLWIRDRKFQIQDPQSSSGTEKSRSVIGDKHPGSATMHFCIITISGVILQAVFDSEGNRVDNRNRLTPLREAISKTEAYMKVPGTWPKPTFCGKIPTLDFKLF